MTDRSAEETLVRYGPPRLIGPVVEKDFDAEPPTLAESLAELGITSIEYVATEPEFTLTAEQKAAKFAMMCEDNALLKREIEEILDFISPPREWVEDGKRYKQQTSKKKSQRKELLHLEKELSSRMKSRQARKTGICPIRHELYTQTFNEIIRQVLLNNPERGLLLLRVRDDFMETLRAYRDLHEQTVKYCAKKETQIDNELDEFRTKYKALDDETKEIKKHISELQLIVELRTRHHKERAESRDQYSLDELQFVKRNYQIFKQHLEQLRVTTYEGGD